MVPSGTVTFLFTDVEGSTRWWAQDKAAMSASLLVHDEALRSAIESNGGYVFTTAGDSFAAAFSRASDAVRAARQAQLALANIAWPGPQLRVRMGLHLGEAEERGGDYFGPVVNTAARVEAAGHGGQVLLTEAVRTASGEVDVTDLGLCRLRDVSEAMRVFQLGGATFPELRVEQPDATNLPVRPNRLVGREPEIERVRQLLNENRLVTITAMGGIGKTRLAIAVGEQELERRRSGVWFIDLTTCHSGTGLAATVAQGLGLGLTSGDHVQQVLTFLAGNDALVILDNCEHLVDDCAAFVERVLATRGSVTILATSREALDIDGERTYVLGPLATEHATSAGVQLFVDRATAVHAEFALTDSNIDTVRSICDRLDGMPLALELAAARLTMMSPAELLSGLDDRFQLLSAGRRRSRQRTLEATLDWSYDLLDLDEQRVFRAVGVFWDGFDLEAVAAVTGLDRAGAARHVEALLAKSLVVRSDRGTSTRFRLLETVKAYAEDRLVDAGEAQAVRDRHAAHFHRVALTDGLTLFASLDVGLALRHDCGNITAAVEWAIQADRLAMAAELLVAAHGAYCLDVRYTEYDAALAELATRADGLDPITSAMVSCRRWNTSVYLMDIPSAMALGPDLSASPIQAFRGVAMVATAYFVAFIDPARAEALLLQADQQVQFDGAADVPQDVIDGVGTFALLVRSVSAFAADDHLRAAASAKAFVSSQRTFDNNSCLILAGMSELLAGDPAGALLTVEALDDHDLPNLDGTEVRALAYLALGDVDQATSHIRRHAVRAALGKLPGESADSILLLAALAQHEGDTAAAVSLLLQMGLGRQPATIGYARHMAATLGITDQFRRTFVTGAIDTAASLATLRAELVRRGWT